MLSIDDNSVSTGQSKTAKTTDFVAEGQTAFYWFPLFCLSLPRPPNDTVKVLESRDPVIRTFPSVSWAQELTSVNVWGLHPGSFLDRIRVTESEHLQGTALSRLDWRVRSQTCLWTPPSLLFNTVCLEPNKRKMGCPEHVTFSRGFPPGLLDDASASPERVNLSGGLRLLSSPHSAFSLSWPGKALPWQLPARK